MWKRAVSGPVDADGKPTGEEAGKVITTYGKEGVIEYDFAKLSSEINAVGQHMKAHGGSRVAIHMHNSVELLVTLFGKFTEDRSPGTKLIEFRSFCFLWPNADYHTPTKIPRHTCWYFDGIQGRHLNRWCWFTAFERTAAKVPSSHTSHLGGGADE